MAGQKHMAFIRNYDESRPLVVLVMKTGLSAQRLSICANCYRDAGEQLISRSTLSSAT
jgi:hypothetical protein